MVLCSNKELKMLKLGFVWVFFKKRTVDLPSIAAMTRN